MKNMDEILKIDTIEQYNNLFGFQTLHPLVSLVDFDAPERQENYRMTIGFYGIFLKETTITTTKLSSVLPPDRQ